MQINHYDFYSALSETNKKQNDVQTRIQNEANYLMELSDLSEVKEYLQKVWDITSPVTNHILADDCVLSIQDKFDTYFVKVVCKNETMIYSYVK